MSTTFKPFQPFEFLSLYPQIPPEKEAKETEAIIVLLIEILFEIVVFVWRKPQIPPELVIVVFELHVLFKE